MTAKSVLVFWKIKLTLEIGRLRKTFTGCQVILEGHMAVLVALWLKR